MLAYVNNVTNLLGGFHRTSIAYSNHKVMTDGKSHLHADIGKNLSTWAKHKYVCF